MNFTFGTNTPKTTAATTLGTAASPATPASGFSMGAPAAGTGLTFGSTPTSVTPFPLIGAGDTKSSASLTATGQPTATVKPIAAAAPLTSTFSLGTVPTTTATTTTPGFPAFGLTATTASTTSQLATPGFSFGAASTPSLAATPSSTAVSFNLTPATTSIPKLGTATTTTLATTATTLSTTPSVTPASLLIGNITFGQLEEMVSKWTHELDEQEKMFISQAAQITNWDTLLNSNSEKIVALNNEVAATKLQQQQLDHELDFILAQQRELEEVLAPLEKMVEDLSGTSDPEREHIYLMAESLDTQLKQMSDDLKEVIEHLNESSRTQDNSDPIVQIGRILNAHMNSLHWIDQKTLNIQNSLENVSKLHDIYRRENERSFRLSYE